MKNNKTTTLGILTIILAIGNTVMQIMNGGIVDYATAAAGITAGLGLLKAADAK